MVSSIVVSKQQGHFGAPLTSEEVMKAYRLIVGIAPIVSFMVAGFIAIMIDNGYFDEMVWQLWAWFTICLCIQSILVLGLFSKKGEF